MKTPLSTLVTTGLLDFLKGLKKNFMKISLNRIDVSALINSGSTDNFIYHSIVKMYCLKSTNCCETNMVATKGLEAQVSGFCITAIK